MDQLMLQRQSVMRSSSNNPRSGFTLVEMLVIAPILVVLIGIAIAYVISLTGETLQTRKQNEMSFTTQAALDDIEQTGALSVSLPATTGTLVSPQGASTATSGNGGTTAFTNTTTPPVALIFQSVATDKNPLDSTRSLIYTGSSPCTPTNQLYLYYTVYFVNANRLLKRTILPTVPAEGICATPFQRNSCNPTLANPSSYARCSARDEVLIEGVSNMTLTLTYYSSNGGTLPASSAPQAASVGVQVTQSLTAAGQPLTYTGTTRVSVINLQN